jgi:hypothetical protein
MPLAGIMGDHVAALSNVHGPRPVTVLMAGLCVAGLQLWLWLGLAMH